jgi:hypothetical protein
MKTPMQEHIEWLKKEKDEHGYEKHPYFECAIEHAESMLEKEEEVTEEVAEEIKLEPIYGSTYCQYSVIENKLEILYKNQEKLLQAIRETINTKER